MHKPRNKRYISSVVFVINLNWKKVFLYFCIFQKRVEFTRGWCSCEKSSFGFLGIEKKQAIQNKKATSDYLDKLLEIFLCVAFSNEMKYVYLDFKQQFSPTWNSKEICLRELWAALYCCWETRIIWFCYAHRQLGSAKTIGVFLPMYDLKAVSVWIALEQRRRKDRVPPDREAGKNGLLKFWRIRFKLTCSRG